MIENWTDFQIMAEESIKIPLNYFYCPYWFLQLTIGFALVGGVILGLYMGWRIGSQSVN